MKYRMGQVSNTKFADLFLLNFKNTNEMFIV